MLKLRRVILYRFGRLSRITSTFALLCPGLFSEVSCLNFGMLALLLLFVRFTGTVSKIASRSVAIDVDDIFWGSGQARCFGTTLVFCLHLVAQTPHAACFFH